MDSREIDFIAVKANEKIYIQVCYLLASPETAEREFSPLLDVPDNYPKIVLSMDTAYGEDHKGIRRIDIRDFLLAGE
jgi:predicted AAA+ superfamily ATPase